MIDINEEVSNVKDQIHDVLYGAFEFLEERIENNIKEECIDEIDNLNADLYNAEEKIEDLEDKELVQVNNKYCDELENFFNLNIELYY